jgi:hypothetical protein
MDDFTAMGSVGAEEADPRNQMVVAEPSSSKYWASLGQNVQDPALRESELRMLASHIHDKQRMHFEAANAGGFMTMWIIAYAAFHGLDPDSMSTFRTQQLGLQGEQLEFVRLCINIWRTYVLREVTQVTTQEVALKSIASNNDVASKLSAKIGDDIVASIIKRATKGDKLRVLEMVAGFAGASFGHLRWNEHGGDLVTVQQPVTMPDGKPGVLPTKVRSGAPTLTIGYPWNVFQEPEEEEQTLWSGIRVNDNRHNLAATYAKEDPDKRKRILAESTDDEYSFDNLFGFEGFAQKNDDACTTIHWYHAASAAMPEGRYVILLGNIVLYDDICPVSEGTPITEHCPLRFIMRKFGYANAWDLLSIQQALNQIVSDEMSNIATYGRQSVAMEVGTTIVAADITTGQRGFFYPQGGKPPQAVLMNELGSGPSILKSYLHKMLDDVSGQNAASRGDPESNVKSGTFAALLHTIATEYLSYRTKSHETSVVQIANQGVEMQRRFGGNTPFLVQLVGIDNRAYVQQYTSESLDGFQGSMIEAVPAMLQNLAGRLDLHEHLKDYAPEDRSAAYEFIATGRSDAFMKVDRNSSLYIDREDERIILGPNDVEADEYDDPWKHMKSHLATRHALLAAETPDLAALMRNGKHIASHAFKYGMMHPLVCGFMDIPAPPPMPGTPAQQFAIACAIGQMEVQMQSGGMGDPNAASDVRKPKPKPGEAGSMQPSGGGPGQLSADAGAEGAAQPGGSGKDSSGVKLPQPASPPPEAAQA